MHSKSRSKSGILGNSKLHRQPFFRMHHKV
jgi:hypothetical protein